MRQGPLPLHPGKGAWSLCNPVLWRVLGARARGVTFVLQSLYYSGQSYRSDPNKPPPEGNTQNILLVVENGNLDGAKAPFSATRSI